MAAVQCRTEKVEHRRRANCRQHGATSIRIRSAHCAKSAARRPGRAPLAVRRWPRLPHHLVTSPLHHAVRHQPEATGARRAYWLTRSPRRSGVNLAQTSSSNQVHDMYSVVKNICICLHVNWDLFNNVNMIGYLKICLSVNESNTLIVNHLLVHKITLGTYYPWQLRAWVN